MVEVKNWKGTVKATCGDKWLQEYSGHEKKLTNASNQVLKETVAISEIKSESNVKGERPSNLSLAT